jgi:hypothetical protein
MVKGSVTPDPASDRVLLRIRFTGDKPEWRSVPLQPGGTYYLEFKPEKEVHLEAVAYYEGSVDFAPAYSPILHLDPPKPIA